MEDLVEDLDGVLAQTGGLWNDLRGARILVTGGTGFFGCWMLETLLRANDRLGVGASAVVVTRDPRGFISKAPRLASHPAVTLQEGDIRTWSWRGGSVSHVIHAGTDTRPPATHADRLRVFDSIVEGTRRTLDIAVRAGAVRFLMASTGAVYGRQPPNVSHVTEDFPGAPDPVSPQAAGAEAKRAAEMLCALHAEGALHPTIARCFAFVGPYLPLEGHLAMSGFLAAALDGRPIEILGDGTPVRSYMYASDLAAWLWTILLRGERGRAYNVGSEHAVSIADAARAVARIAGSAGGVTIAKHAPVGPAERYVPSTERARTELGVTMTVDFDEALRRTVAWHRARRGSHHGAH
ncbi:MAG TPA: NAD-dependent epimerase/dehydratase family protein [Vicinamibacterales bacterium]|nr:NAD-dependent epimerase/dehydratase family protein [Vicinamibacterales bacterium]